MTLRRRRSAFCRTGTRGISSRWHLDTPSFPTMMRILRRLYPCQTIPVASRLLRAEDGLLQNGSFSACRLLGRIVMGIRRNNNRRTIAARTTLNKMGTVPMVVYAVSLREKIASGHRRLSPRRLIRNTLLTVASEPVAIERTASVLLRQLQTTASVRLVVPFPFPDRGPWVTVRSRTFKQLSGKWKRN